MFAKIAGAATSILMAACVALAVALFLSLGQLKIAHVERDAAVEKLASLSREVETNKNAAASVLSAENRAALNQSNRLADAATTQGVEDGKAVQAVLSGRDALRDGRRADRLRIAAKGPERGRSGGGGQSQVAARAPGGEGHGADADRLLPRETAQEADDDAGDLDAFIADKVNLAYAACRVDTVTLRAVLNGTTAAQVLASAAPATAPAQSGD